jgi:hypothetical protein
MVALTNKEHLGYNVRDTCCGVLWKRLETQPGILLLMRHTPSSHLREEAETPFQGWLLSPHQEQPHEQVLVLLAENRYNRKAISRNRHMA